MNERLKIFINSLIVNLRVKSQADFASKIGIARSQLSEILSEKRKVTESLVNKIHSSYPYLNKEWLTNGEGEMMIGVIQNNENGDNINGHSVTINKTEGDYLELIKSLTAQLAVSQQQVSVSQEQMNRLITIIENKL